MPDERWKGQYERMKRSYRLLDELRQPIAEKQNVLPPVDVLFYFCCDVLHRRDWIAATLGTDEDTTKAFARQLTTEAIVPSLELKACCDVANGLKHLELHGKSYVTGERHGHSEVVSQNTGIHPATAILILPKRRRCRWRRKRPEKLSVGEGYTLYTFTMDIDGQQRDAHDVATKAVDAWDNWLEGDSDLAVRLRST